MERGYGRYMLYLIVRPGNCFSIITSLFIGSTKEQKNNFFYNDIETPLRVLIINCLLSMEELFQLSGFFNVCYLLFTLEFMKKFVFQCHRNQMKPSASIYRVISSLCVILLIVYN